ncbi:nucleotidyltransferase [Sphingobium amiense]|uniref:Nucleotidyltransferase n=1 Tax=Sphingobium amiense TaxID=135719 RepID=A0A494VZV4_9SPHN|nr:hypothetical protein [Sphingobium amiense]BBD96656.1 nucleotidyltransferase [Sphingobium amiense]
MSIADTFKQFLSNLAVDNAQTISDRYGEITCALNKNFRDTESKTANTLQVGSYGRHTAINLSYSRRSVSGPLWAFAAAGCIARTTGIAGVCFTAFGLMGFSG